MDSLDNSPAPDALEALLGLISDTHETAHAEPHGWATLKLARRLLKFGGAFDVRLSSPLTLDPETVMRVVYDHSFSGAIRQMNPAGHQTLRKAEYIHVGTHTPSTTTITGIAQTFEAVVPLEKTKSVLMGEQPEETWLNHGPWELVLKGMDAIRTPSPQDRLRTIAGYLAVREVEVLRWTVRKESGGSVPNWAETENRLAAGQAAWRTLNPDLPAHVALVLEELLNTIAHFDVLWAPAPSTAPSDSVSSVRPYLESKRHPVGHWLSKVAKASSCSSLPKLSDRYASLGIQYKRKPIELELLKKWSSGSQLLMPFEALDPVLKAVEVGTDIEALEGGYFLARILTFLSRLLQAGSADEDLTLEAAQAQLNSRYTEVHRLELGRTSSPD